MYIFFKIILLDIYILTKGPLILYQKVMKILGQKDMDPFCWKVNRSKKLTVQRNWLYQKIEFQVLGVIKGAHHTPKVGCFFKMFKIQLFCFFITQLVEKLQQRSLYEVIEDILPLVLNRKRPLSKNCFAYISATKHR